MNHGINMTLFWTLASQKVWLRNLGYICCVQFGGAEIHSYGAFYDLFTFQLDEALEEPLTSVSYSYVSDGSDGLALQGTCRRFGPTAVGCNMVQSFPCKPCKSLSQSWLFSSHIICKLIFSWCFTQASHDVNAAAVAPPELLSPSGPPPPGNAQKLLLYCKGSKPWKGQVISWFTNG